MRYAMAIDTKKCVGCSDCVVACQLENKVPVGFCRDWIVEATSGTYPNLEMELRSERCHHCANPPCVRCCPTSASHVEEGGVVLVDADQCIGCAACIEACPYDARYMHPDGYVDKCTFCIHKVRKGEQPACVQVCPTNCLYFGDLDDPNSEVSRKIKERKYKRLKTEAGTDPQLYFLI